jgi:hypothetical protein
MMTAHTAFAEGGVANLQQWKEVVLQLLEYLGASGGRTQELRHVAHQTLTVFGKFLVVTPRQYYHHAAAEGAVVTVASPLTLTPNPNP